MFTKPKPKEKLAGVIWSREALSVPANEKRKHSRLGNLGFWWSVMALIIVGLYIFTNSRGSNTRVFEAENVEYEVSSNASARLQIRSELAKTERFNLWTGTGQILFTPQRTGEVITFQLPIPKPGQYQIDTLVTVGPDYGKFKAVVNNKNTEIAYPVTQTSKDGQKFSVIYESSFCFDGKKLSPLHNNTNLKENNKSFHAVCRINLGIFQLKKDFVEVSFVAKDVQGSDSLIGVDQFMLTYHKEKANSKTQKQ